VEFEIEHNEPAGSGQWAVGKFIRSFDLSQAPLLHVGLLKLAEEEHLLLVDIHHIVGDGTSMGILIDDFIGFYLGERLFPLNVQYKDFALWQGQLKESGKIREQENFWLSIYPPSVDVPRLDLPFDFPRPAVFSFAGDHYSFTLEAKTAAHLKEIGTRTGSTLYMSLLAAFNILLCKYTSREDIVVGSVVMGRPHTDLLPIAGMFVNTLPLRNRLQGQQTCLQSVKEIKENSIRAFENQDIQFEDLVEKINPPRDPSRNPIFDVSFVVRNFAGAVKEMKSITVSPYPLENKTAKFDLTLFAFMDEQGGEKEIQFVMEYCTTLFKAETIQRMAEHLLTVIRQMVDNPGLRIHEIDLLTEREKQHLLFDFNDTTVDYPKDKTLHQLFAEQVARTPDSTAITGVGTRFIASGSRKISITYNLLNNKSNQLAMLLWEKGAAPDTIVAIMLERSIDMIVAILGTLKADAAYLPIDPDYPQERIDFMLKDSGAGILVSGVSEVSEVSRGSEESEATEVNEKNWLGDFSKLRKVGEGIELILIDKAMDYFTDIPSQHPKQTTIPPTHHIPPTKRTTLTHHTHLTHPTHLCYIIYTSGTTGKPKGNFQTFLPIALMIPGPCFIPFALIFPFGRCTVHCYTAAS
jgi:non-ribosomal peptide synthetase component F